jgi:hypothetical protein
MVDDEAFEEFIQEHEQDEYIVSKYKFLDRIEPKAMKIVTIFTGIFMMIISASILLLPNTEEFLDENIYQILGYQLSYGDLMVPVVAIFGLFPILIPLSIKRAKWNYSVNGTDVAYHELANSLKCYQDRQFQNAFGHIKEFKSITGFSGSLVMQKHRLKQLYQYISILDDAKQQEQLEEVIEETYGDMMSIFISEINDAYNGDDVKSIFDEIDIRRPTSTDSLSIQEVAADLIEPIQKPLRRVLSLVVILGFAIFIGVALSEQWAIVLLTAYVIYLTLYG